MESLAQVFSYEYYEIFRNTYFVEHLRTAAPAKCQMNVSVYHNGAIMLK